MIAFLLTWKEAIFFAGALIVILIPWSRGFRRQLLVGLFVYLLHKPLIANFHPGDRGWWLMDPAAWIIAATCLGALIMAPRWLKYIRKQGVTHGLSAVSLQSHLVALSLIVLALFLFHLREISAQFKTQPDYSFVIALITCPLQYFMGISLLRTHDDALRSRFFLVLIGVLLCVLFVSLVPLYGTITEYRALLGSSPSRERAAELIERWEGLLERNTVPSLGSIRVMAYGRIGDLKLSLGDAEGAQQGYKEALREAPDDVRGSVGLARLLIRSGISEKAREDLQRSIDCHPSFPWERLTQFFPPLQFQEILILAQALEAEGEHKEALDAYREAWQMHPDDLLVNLGLGRVYGACGEYEEAIAALQKILARVPRHLHALSALIDVHERAGRRELAQHYRTIVMNQLVTPRILPSAWKGRYGGDLYGNAGCHARITLLRGRVLFTIQARGTPAQGVGPHMVVMMDKEVIGEAEVTSEEWKTYSFTTDVETGEYTLWVYFTNDLCWEKEMRGTKIAGEDRNLFVGGGEITYVR